MGPCTWERETAERQGQIGGKYESRCARGASARLTRVHDDSSETPRVVHLRSHARLGVLLKWDRNGDFRQGVHGGAKTYELAHLAFVICLRADDLDSELLADFGYHFFNLGERCRAVPAAWRKPRQPRLTQYAQSMLQSDVLFRIALAKQGVVDAAQQQELGRGTEP